MTGFGATDECHRNTSCYITKRFYYSITKLILIGENKTIKYIILSFICNLYLINMLYKPNIIL